MLMQYNYTKIFNVQTHALKFQQDFDLEGKGLMTDCKAASISDNGQGLRVFRVSVM